MKISALILTKNEEEMIGEALSQLKFADEIIVLDQNSQDKTVAIAKKYTDKILSSKSEEFANNRNLLAENAKGDWLLYIDADERLSEENVAEIKEAIKSTEYSAYYFPRQNYILGKFLRYGGWYPDYVPRLFLKKDFKSWVGKVHESPQFNGQKAHLLTPIVHKTARSLKMMLAKSTKWAKIEAGLYFEKDAPKVTILKLAKASVWEFCRRYFIKLGLLDGKVGFVASLYQALHSAMVMTYLWELQNDAEGKFKKIQNG